MLHIDNLRKYWVLPFLKLINGVYFEQNTKEKILWIYMDRVCKLFK